MAEEKSRKSTLVELFLFDNMLSVFLVRPELSSPLVQSHPFGSEESERILNEIPYILTAHEAVYRAAAWSRLSELICQPLKEYLDTSARIIIVPYGLLHFLPLHLLLLDGSPLIEFCPVVYAPSASVLRFCQRRNPKRKNHKFCPRTGIVFGLDFEEEAEVVSRYFEKAEVLTRSNTRITKERILSSCQAWDFVHFSAHGEFVANDPGNSGLVLPGTCKAPKVSHLTLRDVYQMKLDSYLVTLGACSSGLGDYMPGDELLGITRGFLYAGTPSVLASLWPVRNESTVLLMDRFYEHLLVGGLDKADALRESQLEVRRQFAAPGDWAGFILIGDWI